MLKEKQLAELADRSQAMRLKIGTHGSKLESSTPVFSRQEMSQMKM